MKLPFTVEQFFGVFASYNTAVAPAQLVLIGLAAGVLLLLLRPRPFGDRLIAAYLAFLWGWMAIAYHFAFFAAVNPAARFFGLLSLAGAGIFAWFGVARDRLRFSPRGDARGWIGGLLILFALVIYPVAGYSFGHRYPATPTFGLPCPTTIYTIGLLCLAKAPVPRVVFVVPLVWAAIGSTAALTLGVPQDYGLLVAGVAGLAAALFPPRSR